jgi:hypothetical protein
MEAKELRIGNFVKVENDYETIKDIGTKYAVCALDLKSIGVSQLYKDIVAIPITEEWLLNFGFKNKGFAFYDKEKETRVTRSKISPNIWIYERAYSSTGYKSKFIYMNSIHYVHQLQNLFFMLNDEELKIK